MLELFIYLVVLSVGCILGYMVGFEDGKQDLMSDIKEFYQVYKGDEDNEK